MAPVAYPSFMSATRNLTGIIHREGNGFVALCPQLDIASQGESVEEARINLVEAVELFFECADPGEIAARFREEMYIAPFEVRVA